MSLRQQVLLEPRPPQRLPPPCRRPALWPCPLQRLRKLQRLHRLRCARPPSWREKLAPCPARGQPPTLQPLKTPAVRQTWRPLRQLPQTLKTQVASFRRRRHLRYFLAPSQRRR
jgi:hypothetical protein